jgi:hypothetical protein
LEHTTVGAIPGTPKPPLPIALLREPGGVFRTLTTEPTASAALIQGARKGNNVNTKTQTVDIIEQTNETNAQPAGTSGIDAPPQGIRRRSFMKSLAVAGGSLLPLAAARGAEGDNDQGMTSISNGDAAILRFLAAAEILETDLWQQYTEFADLGGPYTDALENIDGDMPPYIEQNTVDEFSHQSFLNAFLIKVHRQPVSLERFRTLPSSPVPPRCRRSPTRPRFTSR